MKVLFMTCIILAGCKKTSFVPLEREFVVEIKRCDSWKRCTVTTSLGRTALMHNPILEQEICSFMPSTNEMPAYFFKCERGE
jgi:hypothetical protein